jgi:hypothetical protein
MPELLNLHKLDISSPYYNRISCTYLFVNYGFCSLLLIFVYDNHLWPDIPYYLAVLQFYCLFVFFRWKYVMPFRQ